MSWKKPNGKNGLSKRFESIINAIDDVGEKQYLESYEKINKLNDMISSKNKFKKMRLDFIQKQKTELGLK